MIGTYVLCPMRVAPLAYTPGIVKRRHEAHHWEVAMPYKDRFVFQVFAASELIPIVNRLS